MRTTSVLIVVFALFTRFPAFAESGSEGGPFSFSLHLVPSIDFPIGESREHLGPAGAVSLLGEHRLGPGSPLCLGWGLGYSYGTVRGGSAGGSGLLVMSVQADVGVRYPLGATLDVSLFASGGYYYSFFNDAAGRQAGGSPLLSVRSGLTFRLSPRFGLSTGASYKVLFSRLDISGGGVEADTLFSGFNTYLGASWFFPPRRAPAGAGS
jgi:hypothetical protein